MDIYVVLRGKVPGFYYDWESCSKQVVGYKNAQFKKHKNLENAFQYVELSDVGLAVDKVKITKDYNNKLKEKQNGGSLNKNKKTYKNTSTSSSTKVLPSLVSDVVAFDIENNLIKEKKNIKLKIWTDGSCRPNPGFGAWGVLIYFFDLDEKYDGEEERKPFLKMDLQGGFVENTTNQRMELESVIYILDQLKHLENISKISFYIDCTTVSDGCKAAVLSWYTNKERKNPDLWRKFYNLVYDTKLSCFVTRKTMLHFFHVDGHSNNVENNHVHNLAKGGVLSHFQ